MSEVMQPDRWESGAVDEQPQALGEVAGVQGCQMYSDLGLFLGLAAGVRAPRGVGTGLPRAARASRSGERVGRAGRYRRR